MIITKLKSLFKPGQPYSDVESNPPPAAGTGAVSGGGGDAVNPVHRTPAGRFPSNGPQPSKIPVLLFYISCTFCVLGSILTVRSFFQVNEEDQPCILLIGIALSALGIVLAIIMNYLNNRENRRILAYVKAKAEEMANNHNSRQKFNESYTVETHGPREVGPNGIH